MAPPLQIGRYVLHGEIASGGMASVHYGRLVGTGGFAKTVAIKRLHRALARADSFRNMILEEARLAARVRHPNVVPPLDVLAEGGELLLVMEYVHGESLSRLLRAASKGGERVPLAVGATILSNVLHGLHAAHEAHDESGRPLDIVHRDISPQNIIVGADGVARVIDFGIAKAVTSEEATNVGTVKGKVPYLAPEQLEGDPATRRTDLYAAAVVFWEVLAGRRLFEGRDDSEILRNILTMEVEPPSVFNPLVPGIVDDVVLRALSRDPQDRYGTAREMALALEASIHLATASVVGAWTERLAADTLAERAARIAEVEASVAPPEESLSPPVSRPPSSMTRPGRATLPPGLAPPSGSLPPPPAPGTARVSIPPPSGAPSTRSVPGPPPHPPTPAPGHSRSPASGPPPSTRRSSPPMRPPVASHPVIEPRTVIYEPPPMPEPAFVEGVRPIDRSAPPPPHLSPPAAGVLRKPELAIRNVEWLAPAVEKPVATSLFRRFLVYLSAFLVLAAMLTWMFAPAIARAWIVTGAAARGMTVTIERVDVSRRAIRLSDVHAESVDVPGSSARAATVVMGLHFLVPETLTVDDVEVTLAGSYGVLGASIDGYRAKYPRVFAETLAGFQKIEVTSGRLVWKEPVGIGTSAMLENVTLDVTKLGVRPLGDDYHLSAPLFTMKIADAATGPWQLDIERQGILARSVVHFDPTNTYPATITRTAADDGSVSLSFDVPATALSDLHLPPALLGGRATDRTRLEAHGELAIVAVSQATTRAGDAAAPRAGDGGAPAAASSANGGAGPEAVVASRSVSGKVLFGAYALLVFPSGPPVDLALDLPVAGDTARPIAIVASLGLGQSDPLGGPSTSATSATMAGTLDLTARVARLEMAGKTGPIACVKADGPPGAAAPSAGSTGLRAGVTATLDDYPGAKVTLQPMSTCSPKLR